MMSGISFALANKGLFPNLFICKHDCTGCSLFIRARVKPYFQDTLHSVLPFEVRIPNSETIDALR